MIAVLGICRIKWARSPRYKAKGPSSRTTSCRVCIKEWYRDPSSRNRVRITSGETKRKVILADWSYRHGISHQGEQKQGVQTHSPCGYAMHEAHVLETAAAPISPKKSRLFGESVSGVEREWWPFLSCCFSASYMTKCMMVSDTPA